MTSSSSKLSPTDQCAFVLSIRPTFTNRILSGEKTIELRRRFPRLGSSNCLALIYSTSPVQAIVASACLAEVSVHRVSMLWRLYGQAAAIARTEFDSYFRGVKKGFALHLTHIIPFENPIPLTDLTRQFEFSPPQSYCYWRFSVDELTTHGRVKTATRYKHPNRAGGQ
jgi:predicted transcriptional regulator